jgi:hypothetical protein
MKRRRLKECFCAACKNPLGKKNGNIVEQIEYDLWQNMLNGGTDF